MGVREVTDRDSEVIVVVLHGETDVLLGSLLSLPLFLV